MNTYTTTKPIGPHPVGSTVNDADLEPFGGAQRLLELQAVTPADDKPADVAPTDPPAPKGRKS